MSDDRSTCRVLVVDDDFHVARIHGRCVDTTPGFQTVATAGTVASAREAIDSARPDLLLVDVYLPDGSGIDLVRATDIDAIVLSAASDPATVRAAVRAGALGYLLKPFEPDVLATRLAAYARYRRILGADRVLDQDAIERALRAVHAGEVRGPAGFRSPTEQAIAGVLADAPAGDELSAVDVAERVGVSRATAQRYLAALAADGRVTVQLRYGSTGRPEHRYRAAAPR